VRRSQRYLYVHDPAYRAWKDDQAAKVQEESLRRQGQVLAEALGQRFDHLVSATAWMAARAAWQPGPAPATWQASPAPVTPAPAACRASPRGTPPPMSETPAPGETGALNALQCKWLSAELGHRVALVPGEHAAVKQAIMAKQADRPMNAALVGFLRRHMPGVEFPRRLTDKVDLVLTCVRDH
jgi:hypothetical protein